MAGRARQTELCGREGGGSTGAVPTSLRIPQPRRGCRRPPGPERRDAGGRRPRSAAPRPHRSRRRDHGVSTGAVPGSRYRAAAPPGPAGSDRSTGEGGSGERGPGLGTPARGCGKIAPPAHGAPTGGSDTPDAAAGESERGVSYPPCSRALSTPKTEARTSLILGIQHSGTGGLYPPMLRFGTPKPGGGARIPPIPALVTPKLGAPIPPATGARGPNTGGLPSPRFRGSGPPSRGLLAPGAAQQVRPLPGPGSGGSSEAPRSGCGGAEGARGAGAGSGAGIGGRGWTGRLFLCFEPVVAAACGGVSGWEELRTPPCAAPPAPALGKRLRPGGSRWSGSRPDRRTLESPASSFVCRAGALTGAGRVGEGRSRQRPRGAGGSGLSCWVCPCRDTRRVLEVLEGSAGSVSPRPGARHGEHPSSCLGLALEGSSRHFGVLLVGTSPWWAPGRLCAPGSDTRGAQQVPLTAHGSPERPWGAGEGWAGGVLGSGWALGLELSWGCCGNWGAAAAGLGRQRGLPVLLGLGLGQLHGVTGPAGRSLFGEENVCDVPEGSSQGKGRAQGCAVPWGGGEEQPGWAGGWCWTGWWLQGSTFTLLCTNPPSTTHREVQRVSPSSSMQCTCQHLLFLSKNP